MHRFIAFFNSTCVSHTILKHKSQKISVKYDMELVSFYTENLSQFHSLLQPRVVFQELNHVLEIPKFHI